ncbi:MAG: substrate-binding and VWA domain-containing protein [Actinomycetota bacterium]|nr:substrate-binding domain-containing protein [Acidimicrobiia bacterium]MDQ3468960.1 substrate-binding and VWA domain-containing protein [Actinomycetota bacterium]
MSRRARVALGVAGAAVFGAACIGGTDEAGDDGGSDNGAATTDLAGADTGDCTVVDMAVSSEKITLLTELAETFNDSPEADVDGRCVFVRPRSVASGLAASLITEGWPSPEANGEPPVIWSPAASGWAGIVNERAGAELAPAGTPFMLTPLVIAMPQPMAEALGWPDEPIGFADLASLADDPEGWAALGHPEWGPFRLGKTNPNYSTSGLNFTIAEYYAATGKTSGLTSEDLARPAAVEFADQIESSVVHYGDITMTFLNNWFAQDLRNTSLTYVSAVAIEEKSLIDYNRGNPDGVLSPGEEPRVPRVPLVAIYPEEGTLFSDNPFIVLDTEWVDADEKAAAALFEAYVQQPDNQAKVLEFGFRPNNPAVALADPIVAANGVDPQQPVAELEVPEPGVLVDILDAWAQARKEARVLLVLDISGSMGDIAGGGRTKLDLAQEAAVSALGQFKDTDEVGLWVFSTDLGGDDPNVRQLVPLAPIGEQLDTLEEQILAQVPTAGTPLYDASMKAYEVMLESYDPEKINAIVLLTDGQNDDELPSDDEDQFTELIDTLQAGSEGSSSRPVRLFTISYGEEADLITLRAIAQATTAASYNASNPATINQVFTAVISNF